VFVTQDTAEELEVRRVAIDKPAVAVAFLLQQAEGVMDLIAHFWERLPQTPPLLRSGLHLVVVVPKGCEKVEADKIWGALLYVPKAWRADVLARSARAAEMLAEYIVAEGRLEQPTGPGKMKVAIDYISGGQETVTAMVPRLLAESGKRTLSKRVVNFVMQFPAGTEAAEVPAVRLAAGADLPVLNRWRRQYREERGILFDADVDEMVERQRAFVLEHEGQIVALAKLDLELQRLVEIGGVFTFPEFRKRGFGRLIVQDLARRIRVMGKTPTLQVDEKNTPAVRLYQHAGWQVMGALARVWLTGG